MDKIKELCKKHKEILLYLVFGVGTTAVGWIVYFAVLWGFRAALSLPIDDTSSGLYLLGYTVAQVIQWVAAVLFAFYTNRKWVFTSADKDAPVMIQLAKFSGGRVITFALDYLVTFFVALGLGALIPAMTSAEMFGRKWNLAEISAKLLAAVIVIVCNYVFSKIFVFKNKRQ